MNNQINQLIANAPNYLTFFFYIGRKLCKFKIYIYEHIAQPWPWSSSLNLISLSYVIKATDSAFEEFFKPVSPSYLETVGTIESSSINRAVRWATLDSFSLVADTTHVDDVSRCKQLCFHQPECTGVMQTTR